ncbi:MAG: hypothetical protein EAZ06_09545 [Cytophagales bacterium]|nr:MAG: hypothetical protein EAY69_07130 [Cytophagales bacterium]TAH28641.1 MAG: hypothetical protein EAZ06_09545 [Cytophagales bacterium]
MKKIILVIISFFNLISVKSQSNNDCRYLMVITYLKSDSAIIQKVKNTFLGKKKNKVGLDFSVHKGIQFLDLSSFKLDSIECKPLLKYLGNEKKFNPYNSVFLEKLKLKSNTTYHLIFSEPIENYLVVEFCNYAPPEINRKIKFGLGLRILFRFDEFGIIDYVVSSRVAYN